MTKGLLLLLLLVLSSARSMALFDLFAPSPQLQSLCAGQCMLCTSCWLAGGSVAGYCGGLVQTCCINREDKPSSTARKLSSRGLETLTQEGEHLQDIQFGPVINDPTCGRPTIGRRRVVGGLAAGFGAYPWQALVRVGKSRCGGALVNRRHVVTAGHCVHGAPAHRVRVFLGEYALYRASEPLQSKEFAVSRVIKHPYYRFSPQADRYDVAVLRLASPVVYEPHIIPICLPDKDQTFPEGTEAMVAGWGAMKPDSRLRPTHLQAVDVEVVDSKRCENWHGRNNITVGVQ